MKNISFDGFGLNYLGDIYHPRLATFSEFARANGHAEKYGRLFEAAPELFEALQELLSDKYLSDPINRDRMEKALAAVAKATG